MSRQKVKAERSQTPRRADPLNSHSGLPLTVSRPELLNDGTDRDFRKLVHNIFAFMARHEAIRDGHARQIGLAGIEYTILISIGHLGLDGDVNVKTVADQLHISGAFVTTVTSKLQTLGLAEKTQDSVDRRRISLAITEKGKALLRKLAPYQRALPRKNLGRNYPVSTRPDDLTALCRVIDYDFSIDTHGDDDAQTTGLRCRTEGTRRQGARAENPQSAAARRTGHRHGG